MTNTACSGAAFSSTPVNVTNGVVPTGTTYSWSAPTVTGGLTGGASGSGASSITGTLTNPTNAAQTATYTVTPLSGSCTGSTFTLTVTVNPKPAITAMTNATCSGTAFSSTPTDVTDGVVPSGTTYSWSAPSVTGGLTGGATGSGASSITGTLTNPTNAAQTATYTVTPLSGSCTGATFTVTVTVNPKAAITAMTNAACSGVGFTSTPTDGTNGVVPTGTTYSWPAPTVTGGMTGGASGSGASSITGTLTNPTGTSQTATYTVTPLSGSCTGSTFTLTVTVTPSVGTPVFSLGSTSTRCGGAATITYTATATNNTGITYSLDATSLTAGNTINSSTGAVTYTSTYVGASVITASAAGCNGPATNTHTVTVGSNTWTGATSVTWSTGSNWSCGAAPLSGQDVVIPNVTRKPSLAANTTVGSLSIASGAFVTIGANTLTINGAVSGSGTLTGSLTSNLTMNGTGTLNFTSGAPSNIVNDFVVNSTGTVTLSGKVNVAGVLTPAAGTLTLTDTLTLRAGTEGNYANTATYPVTGTVGVVGATISYTGLGKITVERYVPAKRSYRFIASSVNTATSLRANWMEGTYNAGPGYGTNNNPKPGYGTHITGSATPGDNLDWTLTNNPSLFNYDNATQTWNAVYNSNGTLAAGYPYRLFVRGNRSNDLSNNSAAPTATILRETGTIVSGNVTLGSVSSSPATMPLINGTTGAFSYVGNPYASPVSWLRILAASTNISPTYYAYDANVNVKGAYVSYNAITGFNQFGNFTTSKVDSIIQPGAAFMIETTGASPVLSFTEQFKKAEFTAVWRTVSTMPKIALQLISATGNNILDGAVTVFDNQYGATIGSEDSYKFSNLDENLSIVSNGKQLSIEARPQAQANDSVPLNLSKYKQSSYFLKIASENFDPSLTAVIKDKYLNVELPVDLVGSTQMPFSITTDPASSAANRFVIIFKPGSILPVTLTDVKAYQKEQGIQVDWTAHTEINVDHYEVEKSTTAQQFEKAGIVNARQNNSVTEYYGWFDKNVVTGNNFYRIKIVDKSGSFKYTDIVKVRIAKGEGSISIFPNPVKNKLMHIQLENLDKGRYNVVLYNNLGEKLMTKVIDHTGRSAGYIVDAGQLVSKGSYRLVVSNGDFQLTETVVFE